MNEPKNPSRRDWFRLRKPHQNEMLSETGTDAGRNVLQSIEHPPNNDGMNLAELPPMHEAILSPEQVESLFADIGSLATDILLMERSAIASTANVVGEVTAVRLMQARLMLLEGSQTRLQIRYRWKESAWIDTLEKRPNGFRLVRISHQDSGKENATRQK